MPGAEHFHLAVVCLHDSSHRCQAQPCAACLGREKRGEELPADHRRNSRSGIPDVDERDARPLLKALRAAREALPADDPAVLAGETAVLRIFADLCALSRNRRGPEDETQPVDPAGEEARNPQEFLYAYLRSRDADAEGLPESFREKLRRAIANEEFELAALLRDQIKVRE